MTFLRTTVFDFISEFWRFMRVRKKFWLLPLFLVVISIAALFFFSQGTVVAPFIYTLF